MSQFCLVYRSARHGKNTNLLFCWRLWINIKDLLHYSIINDRLCRISSTQMAAAPSVLTLQLQACHIRSHDLRPRPGHPFCQHMQPPDHQKVQCHGAIKVALLKTFINVMSVQSILKPYVSSNSFIFNTCHEKGG